MIKITNEDNMKLMSRYKDNYFDLAIVDPPYGIGAGKMTMGKGSRNDKRKNILKSWDNEIPTVEYFKELFRISKNQIIWGGNYFNMKPSRCILIWDKMDYNSDFASAELAWTSFDKVVKTFRHARNSGNKYYKIHPTQKPVKLYEWLLMNYAKEGDKILDTHLGSGSIAIACHNLEYDLTACELDTDYYNDAMKRLKEHQSQLTFFTNK